MKIHQAAQQHYQSLYAEHLSRLPGKDLPWLQSIRQTAYDYFATQGFPTRHDEDWKYTSMIEALSPHYPLATKNSSFKQNPLPNLSIHPNYSLVFIDGYFAPTFSQLKDLPKTIKIHSLANLLANSSVSLAPYLDLSYCSPIHAFSALNTCFLNDGYVIEISAHCKLNTPLHIIFIQTQRCQTYLRNMIVMHPQSKATIIENFMSLTEQDYFTNTVTSIELKEQAKLAYYKIQQENRESFHISNTIVKQHAHSEFESYVFGLGAKLARCDIMTELQDSAAACSLDGTYITTEHQHMDFHTQINHLATQQRSKQLYKGIMDNNGHAVFNGKICVSPTAMHTQANQYNQNLLLSNRATIDTKPQLEIFTDEVKCTHGATVGQLDNEALFYLQSRGINRNHAKQLLVTAFIQEMLDRIDLSGLKEYLAVLLTTRLQEIEA